MINSAVLERQLQGNGVTWLRFPKDPGETRYSSDRESGGMRILTARADRGLDTVVATNRGNVTVRGNRHV